MVDVAYTYSGESGCVRDGGTGGSVVSLATSGGLTADGVVDHPFFFDGFVEHPTVVAAGLVMLARVASTRFYTPPAMVAKILRNADPVVTATDKGLVFESFSACCGVYARMDIDHDSLDTAYIARGVTNIDAGPDLRAALVSVTPGEPLHLSVGSGHLEVTTLGDRVREEKVSLPDRWLKGFAETQVLASTVTKKITLDKAGLVRFIGGLPKNTATKSVVWATPVGRGVRLGSASTQGSVCLAGPERLRVIQPLIRFAHTLEAYSPKNTAKGDATCSFWVLHVPGGRITIGLSPEKSRGFSGEGQLLDALSSDTVGDDADKVSSVLAFDPVIDIDWLAGQTGLDHKRVAAALGVLASSGQVGFDVARGCYFHRPLPLSADSLEKIHPRLAGARKLVEAGAVKPSESGSRTDGPDIPGGVPVLFTVTSGGVDYRVGITADPATDTCTCPWYAKYSGTRGPCKHVLAARTFGKN
ncbi:SWIM zinc finger family protein [Corynebacterium mendelii]|uniref:SWIM zinc finger family protein n=1 Tax=Corynebacterium mendelii TaxID=2765362 RepID=A0A939E1S9_9CORY|nr:SWIM zinc finger family protein [Corynebacterium mendelii]MBN9644864.1 SWIM zinc finger family protein [Corynebacterium mendelii]